MMHSGELTGWAGVALAADGALLAVGMVCRDVVRGRKCVAVCVEGVHMPQPYRAYTLISDVHLLGRGFV
jgi:hypothetical protein